MICEWWAALVRGVGSVALVRLLPPVAHEGSGCVPAVPLPEHLLLPECPGGARDGGCRMLCCLWYLDGATPVTAGRVCAVCSNRG